MNGMMPLKTIMLWMILVIVMTGCTSGSTPESAGPVQTDTSSQAPNTREADTPLPTDAPYTFVEAEKLAGFDVKEPTYLPTGVPSNLQRFKNRPIPL